MNQLKNIHVFFSLSLLFLFATCSFLLVYSQIQGYKKLESNIELANEKYTPIAYLNQKISNYDQVQSIDIQKIDGISCLVLQDDQTTTYIYAKDGYMQELYCLNDMEVNLDSGQELMECQKLDFSWDEIGISYTFNNTNIRVALHSGGWV